MLPETEGARRKMRLYPDARFDNFSWPALYNPDIEVGFLGPPVRAGGCYLTDPDDVFKFTLYWVLLFYLPLNFLAGFYAFLNLLFPPPKSAAAIALVHRVPSHARSQSQTQSYHSRSQSQSSQHAAVVDDRFEPPRTNVRRSRLTFSLLVLLTFVLMSLVRAVVGAAVMAFVLYGVYTAGGFYMSTWVPFLWAIIQSLFAILEIWPSIIDII